MAKASGYTKKCKSILWTLRILDIICLFLPLIIYVIMALASGNVLAVGKVAVVGSVMVAGILVAINVIAQKRLRCPVWIVILGLYIAIQQWLLPLIIILAITSILDDLVFTPLIHKWYTKYQASVVVDEREANEDPQE